MSREALQTRSRSLKDICTTPEVIRISIATKSMLASRALVCGVLPLALKLQTCSDAAQRAGCSNVLRCTGIFCPSPDTNSSPHLAKHGRFLRSRPYGMLC